MTDRRDGAADGDTASNSAAADADRITDGGSARQRKKRLSRKEQKARKKQKKKEQQPRSKTTPVPPTVDSGNRPEVRSVVEDSVNGADAENTSVSVPATPASPSASVSAPKSTTAANEHSCDETYTPVPVPPIGVSSRSSAKAKSLGKWFPSAKVVKGRPPKDAVEGSARAALVLFYQYVTPTWSDERVDQIMAYIVRIAERRQLGGRIRIAPEGVNATLSSVDDGSIAATVTLRHFARDLRNFDAKAFEQTHFKYVPNLDPNRHFTSLKVLPVKELVYYGLGDDQAPLDKRGVHLHPKDFHRMLEGTCDGQRDNETIVVDVRNHYEAAIGRFDGQERIRALTDKDEKIKNDVSVVQNVKSTVSAHEKIEGAATITKSAATNDASVTSTTAAAAAAAAAAEYVDPKMRKSTDFPAWLSKPETQEKLKGKHVLLYCTGGVRCERASAHLNKKLGDSVKGVYQLEGGIEHYLQHFPDGGLWRGKNFVFDKREAFDAKNWNGDGGTIQPTKAKVDKKQKGKRKGSGTGSAELDGVKTACCVCDRPWDRYVGKRKCDTCGVPVLMCDTCMSMHSAKARAKQKSAAAMGSGTGDGKNSSRSSTKADDSTTIRCPLCKEENVTVKVEEVEYTKNGVAVRNYDDDKKKNGKNDGTSKGHDEKAAPSVLKWGGGHASQKKEKRRYRHRPCRFGAECVRPDCFFAHPGRR